MTATEYVVLVDKNNCEIGVEEKITAHKNNLLHRAFSVFILSDDHSEILLQQRALSKYHSAGLWTNTCCSHPRAGEDIIAAGVRRLGEEIGINTQLQDLGWFYYHSEFDNGLHEHEIDHVLIGAIPKTDNFDWHPEEVHAMRWVKFDQLQTELSANPEKFTPWLAQALEKVKGHLAF